jgi:hypothetical protein
MMPFGAEAQTPFDPLVEAVGTVVLVQEVPFQMERAWMPPAR